MNLMLQPNGGTSLVPGLSSNLAADAACAHDPLVLRLLSGSSFYEPTRRLLRPFIEWLRDPSNVATVVLAMIVAPLVVILLLPLFLVLIPVFLFMDSAAVIATTRETDADDTKHDSLVGHVMR